MITNNSKKELNKRIEELEGRVGVFNKEITRLQDEIDFIKSRKQELKNMIDDPKADCA